MGPVWEGGTHGELKTLASCYEKSLALAEELGCTSVAFPLIGTGSFAIPKDQALKSALSVIGRYLLDHDMDITLVVYDPESFAVSKEEYSAVQEFIDENMFRERPLSNAYHRRYAMPAKINTFQERLLELIGEIPDSLRMLHGDFHVKNIMLQNNESLLIDMDTLCCGDPVFELAAMYNAYVGFGVIDPSLPADFFGFSYETCNTLWSKTLALYLDTTDSEILQRAEDKAKLIGIIRIMRRLIRHQELETDTGRRMMDYCRKELADLLPRVDSLAVNG